MSRKRTGSRCFRPGRRGLVSEDTATRSTSFATCSAEQVWSRCPSPRQPVSSRCSVAKSPRVVSVRGGVYVAGSSRHHLGPGSRLLLRGAEPVARRGRLPSLMRLAMFTHSVQENGLGRAFCLWLLARELNWDVEIVAPQSGEPWLPLGEEQAFLSTFVSDPVG